MDRSVRFPVTTPKSYCGGGEVGVRTIYAFPNQTGFPDEHSRYDAYCFRGWDWLGVVLTSFFIFFYLTGENVIKIEVWWRKVRFKIVIHLKNKVCFLFFLRSAQIPVDPQTPITVSQTTKPKDVSETTTVTPVDGAPTSKAKSKKDEAFWCMLIKWNWTFWTWIFVSEMFISSLRIVLLSSRQNCSWLRWNLCEYDRRWGYQRNCWYFCTSCSDR